MTTIVIDDSPLQRLATCKLVKSHSELELLESFSDPKMGLAAVNRLRPELIFLDVEMPGFDGFEVLQNLSYDCQVILNSTRSQFALTAFQYEHVKDFLTKPMNGSRFETAVDRVLKNQLFKNNQKEGKTFIELDWSRASVPVRKAS